MAVLRKKSKRDIAGFKYVGAYCPPRLFNYITLYSLAKQIPKATIMLKLLGDWMGQQVLLEPEDDLVTGIVQRAEIQWKVTKATTPDTTYTGFKDALKDELIDKGLRETYIRKIMAEL